MLKSLLLVLLLATSPVYAIQKSQQPVVTAKSWLVANDSQVIDSRAVTDVRSIASITKLFTVMTVMQEHRDLSNEYITYNNSLKVTREDLIEMALVRSDNRAADLLCKSYRYGYNQCISDMNTNAKKWGLTQTELVDATGLDSRNVSTAEDLLKLLKISEQNYMVVRASAKTKVEIKVKKRWFTFKQTNPLVGSKKYDFVVSKTGTTTAAGGCIVLSIKTDSGIKRVVILGSKNGRTRILEAEIITDKVS